MSLRKEMDAQVQKWRWTDNPGIKLTVKAFSCSPHFTFEPENVLSILILLLQKNCFLRIDVSFNLVVFFNPIFDKRYTS